MRILVIEDEQDLLADIKTRLQSESYIVDTSADGNEGYFFATEYPLDAAIIDIGLPGMSGIEIIQKLILKILTYITGSATREIAIEYSQIPNISS